MKRILLVASLGALAAMTAAQTTPNPIATALRANLKSSAAKMVQAAEEMPADKFGFKPTPESMSFGQLTLHVATSNESMCMWISGAAPAPKTTLTATSSKAELVALLQQSFDYCGQALAHSDDSQLGEPVPSFGGRKASRGSMMMALSDDWADHYSQQAAYLRLNGLLPPTAQPKAAAGHEAAGVTLRP